MSKDLGDTDLGRLREQLERLSRLIRQQGFEDGLNPAQWEALRYISRANRFSNSPGALAQYLGSTKGTVSQTILSLEKKGLLEKLQSAADARVVLLALTSAGTEMLAKDPLSSLSADIGELSGKTARRLAKGIVEILQGQIKRQQQSEFGGCLDCRHWRDRSGEDQFSHCMLFDAQLAKDELAKLCLYHLQR
ncbi:MAG: MarR family transcriptional regulator [Aestuariivirga sp.]